MAAAIGSRKTPIGITGMRPETVSDINRGSVRGWIVAGAVALAVVAILSWPSLVYVVVGLAAAAGLALVAVWTYRVLPDAELEARRRRRASVPGGSGPPPTT